MIRAHQKLKAWQLAMALVKEIYAMTSLFPKTERYGMTTQMRRAALSVPSNIAEGAARQSVREFKRLPAIARGSLAELETQLILTAEPGIGNPSKELQQIVNRLLGLISGLMARQAVLINEANR